MPKKAGIVCVILGAVLIGSALLLFARNRMEDQKAGQEAEKLLAEIETVIAERTAADAAQSPSRRLEVDTADEPAVREEAPQESAENAERAPETGGGDDTVMLSGYDFIGYLELPTLGLRLPVMSSWDYDRLKISPCRQFGAVETDDLVIAAHNYRTHFARLGEMKAGDSVRFTELDGTVNQYTVSAVGTVLPEDVEAVQNSGYALVLYTCTKGKEARVTVYCSRADG